MKEITVILFASVKFAMTFPLAILEFKMGILRTLLWTNLGGLVGIFFFTFLSEQILHFWRFNVVPAYRRIFNNPGELPARKKVFTRRTRRIVRIKSKYGLAGIAFATPILLSIPLGTFLIVRYFDRKPKKLIFLAGSNLFWSMIYTSFYSFFYEFYKGIF